MFFPSYRPFSHHGFALLVACSALLTAPAFADDPKPLTSAESQIFWSSPEDSVPEVRHAYKKENEGQHFLYCDELHLELFEPGLRNLGGGYMGVGTDQAYLFIGWMRPQFAWLTDYDPLVQVMHRLYALFFAEATTPTEFVTLWRDRKVGLAVINQRAANDPQLPAFIKLYTQQQPYTLRRLDYLTRPVNKVRVKTFVNDAEDYAYVRALVAARRVRPMLGNLLSDKGLKGAGDAARKLNVPIRALYVSNAEQYWKYSAGYRQNVQALPFDAKSWLVRTQASKPSNHDYRYYLQSATLFATQLNNPKITTTYEAVPYVAVDDPTTAPLTTIDADGKRTLKWNKPPVKPIPAAAVPPPGSDP